MDNACIQVSVYDNRVEITSPGTLFGLTIEIKKNIQKYLNLFPTFIPNVI